MFICVVFLTRNECSDYYKSFHEYIVMFNQLQNVLYCGMSRSQFKQQTTMRCSTSTELYIYKFVDATSAQHELWSNVKRAAVEATWTGVFFVSEEYTRVIFVVVYAMKVMCLEVFRLSRRNIMRDLVRIFSKLKLWFWFKLIL